MNDQTKCDCINCRTIPPAMKTIADYIAEVQDRTTQAEEGGDDHFDMIDLMKCLAEYALSHVVGAHVYAEYQGGADADDAGGEMGRILRDIMDTAMDIGVENARDALEAKEQADNATQFNHPGNTAHH